MNIDALAKKIAEYANTCCYRSDGFEENVLKVAREAITDAVVAEREACAKVCEEDAFVDQWRGLGEAAKRIRERSNMEFSGQAASPRSSAGTQG